MKTKIHAIRTASGLTQVELAEKIGANQKEISLWENGKRIPDVASLKKLAGALGCKIDDLV